MTEPMNCGKPRILCAPFARGKAGRRCRVRPPPSFFAVKLRQRQGNNVECPPCSQRLPMADMSETAAQALWKNFLGPSPSWYKKTIVAFLLLNPLALLLLGPFVTGWILIAEFIFTLALALRCYPLQPGGLLAIEAVLLGMTSPHTVFDEAAANFEVILLLMFMVAGIYFMKELLLFVFTRILLKVRSKVMLSLLFCLVAAWEWGFSRSTTRSHPGSISARKTTITRSMTACTSTTARISSSSAHSCAAC